MLVLNDSLTTRKIMIKKRKLTLLFAIVAIASAEQALAGGGMGGGMGGGTGGGTGSGIGGGGSLYGFRAGNQRALRLQSA